MALSTHDQEAIKDALNAFADKPGKEIPAELEKLLNSIAITGRAMYPWSKVKLLLVQKLENVIEDYLKENPDENMQFLPNVENVTFTDMKQRLLTNINKFKDAPFTIQRICELLVSPKKYYLRRDKFMRGIEKNILIVTTVTPAGKRITSLFDGSKSTPMVNGILSESNIPNGTQSKDSQFRVPSSPSTAKQLSSSSEESSMKETSQGGSSEEPAPKKIKLGDLPDQPQEMELPSTSEDSEPSLGKENNCDDVPSESSMTSDNSEDGMEVQSSTEGMNSQISKDELSCESSSTGSGCQSLLEGSEAQTSSVRLKDQIPADRMEVQSSTDEMEDQNSTQGVETASSASCGEGQSSAEEMEVQSSSQQEGGVNLSDGHDNSSEVLDESVVSQSGDGMVADSKEAEGSRENGEEEVKSSMPVLEPQLESESSSEISSSNLSASGSSE
ncbi:Serine/threonine-protein phosphatase 4 regulatory subunit 2 [Holothuria leucospilota]|uniref:Serine/threonine-protein phosphatase 4 regulatory subunit 2 n=1 Tax=Holothuria leucospilota TaxID=206669 RepID=A0A9Q1HJE6_HOLLE|nr:Serine/threonine-protein phosphatase 4 regulatory subunit 2 [Holothuria leucospilota]